MKLSSLTTDQALDVLCEITPYLSNIASDEDLVAELKRKITNGEPMSKGEMIAYGVEKVNALAAILLKKKRNEIYGILAALNGKTVAEIEKQNVITTGCMIRDIAKDKAMLDFFKSFALTGEDG